MDCIFGVIAKKSLPIFRSQDFYCFLLGVLLGLFLHLWPWFTPSYFCACLDVWIKVKFFWVWTSSCSSTVCWEFYPFPKELLLHLCECGGENSNIFFSLIVRFTAVAPIVKDRLTREKHGNLLFIAEHVTWHGSLPKWKPCDKGIKFGFILFFNWVSNIYYCAVLGLEPRAWSILGKHVSTEAKLAHFFFCASVCEARSMHRSMWTKRIWET